MAVPMVPRIDIEPIKIPQVEVPRIPPTRIFENAPPVVDALRQPIIDVPYGEIPSYEPPELPEGFEIDDGTGRAGEKEKEESEEKEETRDLAPLKPPVVPKIEISPRPEAQIPFTDISVPLPTGREVSLAGTTAVASTAAALMGKSLVEQLIKIFKPISRKLMLSAKSMAGMDLTPYETQMYFELAGSAGLKKITQRLKKEQKTSLSEQAAEWAELQERQRRQRRRESLDETLSHSSSPPRTEAVVPVQSPDEPYPPQLFDD